jgi:hypothetical protein
VVDSLNPPWQECEYRFQPTGLLALGTVADERLRNSVEPTTAADDYAKRVQAEQERGPIETVDQHGYKAAAPQNGQQGIQLAMLTETDTFSYEGYLIERQSFGAMPFGDEETCRHIVERFEEEQARAEAEREHRLQEAQQLLRDLLPVPMGIAAGYACRPYRL